MLKKILIGSAAAVSMTASALAADLPRRAPPPLPPPPVYGWTGCYVGANGGGAFVSNSGFGNNNNRDVFVETVGAGGVVFPVSTGVITNGGNNGFFGGGNNNNNNNRGGPFGGGQLGCNLQTGIFVFGAELDAQGTRVSSVGFGSAINVFGGVTSVATTQRIDYFGTARGRVGITFGGPGWGAGPGWGPGPGPGPGWGFGGPVMIYATGGFAFAGVRDGFASTTGIGPFTLASANIGNNGRTGFAAGGGIEWLFLPNWSIKGEYQFIGLRQGPVASANEFLFGTGTTFLMTRRAPSIGIHTARVGINYHFFSAPPAPVVARY